MSNLGGVGGVDSTQNFRKYYKPYLLSYVKFEKFQLVSPHRNSFFKRGKVRICLGPGHTLPFERIPNHRRLTMKQNKAYLELRDQVMERDNHQCVVCHKGPRYLNLAHILPEEFPQFNKDIDNLLMLCPGHHKLGKYSCHNNPLWFIKWLSKNRPCQYWVAMDRLRKLEDEN